MAPLRTTNPINPDYPNYGGKGVKFLLTYDQLVADIDLPKNAAVSLDRIVTAGHYEVGNIRWTNKHVQASNKKHLIGKSGGDIYALAHAKQEAQAEQAIMDRLWRLGVQWQNLRYLTKAEREFVMSETATKPDLRISYMYEGQTPCTFDLPALTLPGATIRLQGTWFPCSEEFGQDAVRHGVIRHVGSLEPQKNICQPEIDAIDKVLFSSTKAGLIWIGPPSAASAMHRPIDGKMMAFASYCYRKLPGRGAIYPVRQILAEMNEPGWNWPSELEFCPILNAQALFIPDLQVDCGPGWQIDPLAGSQLLKLLQMRQKQGLKTFIGVQRLERLPQPLALHLAMNFDSVMVGSFETPSHPAPEAQQPDPDEFTLVKVKKAS